MINNTFTLILRRIAQWFAFRLAQIFVLIPFFIKFNVRVKWTKEYRRVRGAYVILGQHHLSWDPVLITLGGKHPPHWVANDALFRKKGVGWIIRNICACIPISKNMSDLETIKLVRMYAGLGARIGIFPEGQQTWDGKGLPPVPGTAKLLRFLKLPVVFVHSEGAYLSKARWNWGHNRRPIRFYYEVGFSADELRSMKLSEIDERLNKFLDYDEYALQEKQMVPLSGETRAENMELTLFACPRCEALNTLRSEGNHLSCTACGFDVTVDRYGFFDWGDGETRFKAMPSWNQWQQELLREAATQSVLNNDPDPLFQDDRVWLRTGRRRRPLVKIDLGTIRMYHDRMVFSGEKGERVFGLTSVTGMSIFKQHFLEFHYNKELFRLDFTDKRANGYKYMCLFGILNKLRA